MTVFKAFLKVLNKCKTPIIMYTVILIAFGGLNMQTSDSAASFVTSKPDVLIVNEDEDMGITHNLIQYIQDNCNIVSVKDDEEARNDALFYRDVSYIIYIPADYRNNFLDGKNPEIKIKSTGDGEASYAEMLLTRYLRVANIYEKTIDNEEKLIVKINEALDKEAPVEMTSHLDTGSISKASFYYNFLNYSILAGCVYVICLILSSFKNEKISKRTVISSMNYRKHNRILLASNFLFAIVLWLFYVAMSFILTGRVMCSGQGIIYIVNSFVFTICATTLAFLIGNLVKNKNAINGIINVVALGSSFLCGAFVPADWLPASVLSIAHFLPSYWYIQTNELVKTMETINYEAIKPAVFNMGMVLVFSVIFIILSNMISRKNRKIA